jgi:hypothetical protein
VAEFFDKVLIFEIEGPVEKDSLSANKWNEVDGRKTDVRTTKPTKKLMPKLRRKESFLGSERKRVKMHLSLSRINPIVRTV